MKTWIVENIRSKHPRKDKIRVTARNYPAAMNLAATLRPRLRRFWFVTAREVIQ